MISTNALLSEDGKPATTLRPDGGAERRKLERHRMAIPCVIRHGPWGERCDGVVRDVHAEGARVRAASFWGDLHGEVWLSFRGEIRRARVVWSADREAGLRFEDLEIESAKDAQVARLRSKLAELRSR